jgi:hypothetical protein
MITFDEIKNAVLSNPLGNVRILKNGEYIPIKGLVRNESTGEILIIPIYGQNFNLENSYSLNII